MHYSILRLACLSLVFGACAYIDDALYENKLAHATDWDGDGVKNEMDCDPNDPQIAALSTFYLDGDNDGYGDPEASVELCEAIARYVPNSEDCDDLDYTLNPDTWWFADKDEDGWGDEGDAVQGCISSEDYPVRLFGDCDDENENLNPGAEEVIDAFDNNCDEDKKEVLTNEIRLNGGRDWEVGWQGSFRILNDVTGNGLADLAAGFYQNSNVGEMHIAEWDPSTPWPEETNLSTISNRWYYGGVEIVENAGWIIYSIDSIWPAGDINGDGTSEFWVAGAHENTRRIALMVSGSEERGNSGPFGSNEDEDVEIGTENSPNFAIVKPCSPHGNLVTPTHGLTGQWVGDDSLDLALGFYRGNETQNRDLNGRVLLVNGDLFDDGSRGIALTSVPADNDIKIYGSPGEHLGAYLQQADLNDDGFEDLLVVSVPTLNAYDTLSILLGPLEGMEGHVDNARSSLLSFNKNPDSEARKPHGQVFDAGLAQPADTNGDGYPDLIISLPYLSESPGVYILENNGFAEFNGKIGMVATSKIVGEEGFGASVLTVDFSQDGVAEIVVGQTLRGPPDDELGSGSVFVFKSIQTGRTESDEADAFIQSEENIYLGAGLDAGDLNGSGFPDLVLGTPGWSFDLGDGTTNTTGSIWAIHDPLW